MDYATLSATIKGYVENDFPATVGIGGLTPAEQIATFVTQAEQRIFHTVQLLDLRRNVTGCLTAFNRYMTLPADWLATFSFAVIDPVSGRYDYLLDKDVNFIREAFPVPTMYAKPTHYSFFDANTVLLGPTPDLDYDVELHYFYYPESITTAGRSWLGDKFDSVLLYGSLLEAYTFMKGEEDIIVGYQKRYDEALAMLKQLGEGKNRQDTFRNVQTRYPVK
ncbi:MAG: hypothetical protein DDT25_00112 [Chloroflexi bacterium]|nr:hypothetical protein [Chloroflexota bacterium]